MADKQKNDFNNGIEPEIKDLFQKISDIEKKNPHNDPENLTEKEKDQPESNQQENSDAESDTLTKPAREFHIDMGDELDQIPEYSLNSQETKEKKHSKSVFFKMMFAVIIVGVSVFLSVSIIFGFREIFGVGRKDSQVIVDIPKNAGLSQVADRLEANGIIRSSELFKIYYKIAKPEGSFRFGTYSLNTNMSYDVIISELFKYSASSEEASVVFPEGITLYQMAQKLDEEQICDAKKFLDAVDNSNFNYDFLKKLSENPLKFHKLEGYLFPDTYTFFKNDDPVNVAVKMLNNFNKKMTDEFLNKMNNVGFSLDQTMTVASIVQKEAGNTTEMRKVASVYFNRLKNKGVYPNLQACPTRDYANELKKQMTVIDQTIVDAYNTYESKGLPPGPICNPGIEAIEATLNPEDTDYFYFCSNLETGEFFYAKTLQQHERNIIKAGLQ